MRDEDFYYEESNPKKVALYCFLILVVLAIIATAFYFYRQQTLTRVVNVTIELGNPIPDDISVFMRGPGINNFTLDTSNVRVDEYGNTNTVGEFSFRVSHGGTMLRGRVFVVDETPPTAEVFDLIIGIDDQFTAEDFIASCYDNSGVCFVEFARESYQELNTRLGNHQLSIIISDQFDNSITKRVNLTVERDSSNSNQRTADLNPVRLYPEDNNWDETFTLKFTRGLFENSEELDDYFLMIVNEDFNARFNDPISEIVTMSIFNQYDFVIGLVVRIDFENGRSRYISNLISEN